MLLTHAAARTVCPCWAVHLPSQQLRAPGKTNCVRIYRAQGPANFGRRKAEAVIAGGANVEDSMVEIVNVTGTDPTLQNLIVYGSVIAAAVFALSAAFKGEPELCEGCEGTGGARCFACDGTGRTETAQDTGEGKRPGNRYECKVCDGSGLLACKRCNGSGLQKSL